MGTLEAIRYGPGPPARLQLLDQRLLPLASQYIDVAGPNAAWTAIKDMQVRGAPAIAITAALSLAVELVNAGRGSQFGSAQQALQCILRHLEYLVTSRPTAVNLADAARRLSKVARVACGEPGASAVTVTEATVDACEALLAQDIAANQALAEHGALAVLDALRHRGSSEHLQLLTHCNTGSLATAAYGTALGVVRTLHKQGSRLTAYELVHDGLPGTLIVDSAASALMAAGKVDAIIVGADRVAANGDTANKIGTLSLAVNAARYKIPFFVAAPTTTLDASLATGQLIEIEQRPAEEVTHTQGRQIAASGIEVWNPAFDVTPADLIAGIITEQGPVPKSAAGSFLVSKVLGQSSCESTAQANGTARPVNGQAPAQNGADSRDGAGFVALDVHTVTNYLAGVPHLASQLGPAGSAQQWKVQEVGDGNINFVYIVEGPHGALVVKQGLPYIRIAPDWPLTQDRCRMEAQAMAEEAKHCPQHVPRLHHFDAAMALLVMDYLPPPHDILRRALVAGQVYPKLANHVATFLACTLFRTSLLALDSRVWREEVARFQNTELCRLTEQVIFTDPYYAAPVNRHTSPQLDAVAASFRTDVAAKVAAARLKAKFCEQQQALLHGDLHTGSLMVTPTSTWMIDAEFACYGPMAFDVCKMIANLLLAYFASDGYASPSQPRIEQRTWLLQAVQDIWTQFRQSFTQLWDEAAEDGAVGDLYPLEIFPPGPALHAAQQQFFTELFLDTLSFAGAVMIRRILGIAHVIDFEQIADADIRAICEQRALRLGRRLLVQPESVADAAGLSAAAAAVRLQDGQQPCYL